MTELKTQYLEGSPWFWKIFGGAIMGLVSILLLSHFTNINHNIDRSFLDLRNDLREVRSITDAHRDRLVSLEQGGFKEKVAIQEKTILQLQSSLEEQKQKNATNEASIAAIKEDNKTLREWNKELSKTVNEMREKLATLSATQKSDVKPVEKK